MGEYPGCTTTCPSGTSCTGRAQNVCVQSGLFVKSNSPTLTETLKIN